MSIKYIKKNKDDKWQVSTSKSGRPTKITRTQKEAIIFAESQKNTEGIMIKKTSGWSPAPMIKISANTAVKSKESVTKKPKVEVDKDIKRNVNINKSKIEINRPNSIKKAEIEEIEIIKEVDISETIKPRKRLPGWVGVLIGLIVIGFAVGAAFLIGYLLK